MKTNVLRKTIEIDAAGKAVGRVASQVAKSLLGKHKADYLPHNDSGDKVVVNNAGKVIFTGKKLVQKDYFHHSMHPGGIKQTSMKKVFDKDAREVMRKAVAGMLPKGPRRDSLMKRLTVNK